MEATTLMNANIPSAYSIKGHCFHANQTVLCTVCDWHTMKWESGSGCTAQVTTNQFEHSSGDHWPMRVQLRWTLTNESTAQVTKDQWENSKGEKWPKRFKTHVKRQTLTQKIFKKLKTAYIESSIPLKNVRKSCCAATHCLPEDKQCIRNPSVWF